MEEKNFICTQPGCNFECKTKGELEKHLWQVHNINTNGKFKIHKYAMLRKITKMRDS